MIIVNDEAVRKEIAEESKTDSETDSEKVLGLELDSDGASKSDSRRESDSKSDFDYALPENPKQVRSQLRQILLVVFLVAVGLTAYRWYQSNYVVPHQPITWHTDDWKPIEAELERGRRVLLMINEERKPLAKDPFRSKFETADIRRELYLASIKPMIIFAKSGDELHENLQNEYGFEKLPVAYLVSANNVQCTFDREIESNEIFERIHQFRFGK